MRKRFSFPKVLVVTVLAGAAGFGCETTDPVSDSGTACDGGNLDTCVPNCSSGCDSNCDGNCVYVPYLDAGSCECIA